MSSNTLNFVKGYVQPIHVSRYKSTPAQISIQSH